MSGLEDFRVNDVSYHKLGKLITKAPSLRHWSDENIFSEVLVKNPGYDSESEERSRLYMSKLIQEEVGGRSLSFDEQFRLTQKFIPKVNRKFSHQDEFIYKRKSSFW